MINCQKKVNGATLFSVLCTFGYLECLKYCLSIENEYKVKIDKHLKRSDNRMSPLICACSRGHSSVVKHLINDIYKNDQRFDINDSDKEGRTLLWYCCKNGDISLCELLMNRYKNIIEVNKCDNQGISPFFAACDNNQYKLVSFMINNFKEFNINVNQTDNNGWSPLMKAVSKGHGPTVHVLCQMMDVKLLDIKDKTTARNTLDTAVFYGHTYILSKLLVTLFKRHHIEDWVILSQYPNVLNAKMINQWLNMCLKENNSGCFSFLTKLSENGWIPKNFALISSMLESASSSSFHDGTNDHVKESFIQMKCDLKISDYLHKNLSEQCKNEIFSVVSKGIDKYQACFNDSLLLLLYKIDSQKLYDILSDVTKECLKSQGKEEYKYQYFKQKLLKSNVWSMMMSNNENSDEKGNAKESKDENDVKVETNHRGNASRSLFDGVNATVITKELEKQKKYIKQQMIELETQFSVQWDQLKHNVKTYNLIQSEYSLSQMKLEHRQGKKDYLVEKGVLSDYESKDMPFDNVNGFNGSLEYDLNGYLTKLLILSHNINPLFQRDCKHLFSADYVENYNIVCKYKDAPVKTRERCIAKSKMDYFDREWPHSSNLLDTVRCSVSFDDIESFLKGFNLFYSKYNGDSNAVVGRLGKSDGIQFIVRIKNDFSELNGSDQDYHYCDVKFNVLLEYNGQRLIGEIQFLLKFMLTAKKMGHSIYSFQRKYDFYKQLNEMIYFYDVNMTDNYIYGDLRKHILSHSMFDFSSFLFHSTPIEQNYIIKNKNVFDKLLHRSQWNKGKELFDRFFN